MGKGRWAALGVVVCLVVTVAAVAYAAGQAKAVPVAEVVRARRFELVDADGKERAVLRIAAEGTPMLVLWDNNGKVSAGLGLGPDGSPNLALVDANGKGSVLLSSSSLVLFDGNRRYRVTLGLTSNNAPSLSFWGEKGEARAVLSLNPDSGPSLELYDEKGKSRAALGATDLEAARTGTVEKRPESSLVLFDKEGKVLWQAP